MCKCVDIKVTVGTRVPKQGNTQRLPGMAPLQCQVVQGLVLCLSELAEKSGAHTHTTERTQNQTTENEKPHWQLSTLSLTASR